MMKATTTHLNPNSLLITLALCSALTAIVLAQGDNGIPASKAKEFEQKYDSKTGSRTYYNKKTDQTIFFNPKTAEVWFNPVTKKYEAVIREDGSPDARENEVKTTGDKNNYQKTEKWFNPVTKTFEDVLVEAGPNVSKTPDIQYPNSLDNGLPAKTAKNWQQIIDDKTGSSWRTYKNTKTGETVSFNPKISELWFNPVKSKWEPVVRETSDQRDYIKQVAREWAEKNKPKNAKGWRCNFSGAVHNTPTECQDPDQGGVWVN